MTTHYAPSHLHPTTFDVRVEQTLRFFVPIARILFGAIIGATLLIAYFGAGPYSLDERAARLAARR